MFEMYSSYIILFIEAKVNGYCSRFFCYPVKALLFICSQMTFKLFVVPIVLL